MTTLPFRVDAVFIESDGSMADDRRDVPRYELTLPIRIGDDTWGVTRNLSLDGVQFEAQKPFAPGEELDVTIYVTVDDAASVMRLQALARVLRTEPIPHHRHTIAARLEDVRVLTDVPLTDYSSAQK
jgi:hypothetical protein